MSLDLNDVSHSFTLPQEMETDKPEGDEKKKKKKIRKCF